MRFSIQDVVLALISLSLVFYAEWYYPLTAFNECSWPLDSSAKRIALIADPQLVDAHTYPGRNWLMMWFTRVVADRYMARNFRLMNRRLKPQIIFYLGDLFDGGREWNDKEWYQEFSRWHQVFPSSPVVQQVLNLPGNHDVGSVDEIIPNAFQRFRKNFGDPNNVIGVDGYSIITLDTNSLMNTNMDSINGPAKEFFQSLKSEHRFEDRNIILSHVPFFRPDGSYCGFEREGEPFKWQKGDQYVTEVNPALTQDILMGLEPKFIFSGDDHDACEYKHSWGTESEAREYTVKSFSLAMGIERPGFQLLSLADNEAETDSCMLGKPFYPIIFQGVTFPLLLIAAFIYLAFPSRRPRRYERVGEAEMGTKQRVSRRFSNDLLHKTLIVGFSWLFGQSLINWWSYSAKL